MSLIRYINISTLILLIACNDQREEALVYTGETMGTTYSVTLPGRFSDSVPINHEDIDALLESINRSMSTYLPESELSQLNMSDSTDWQEISADLFRVLSAAQDISTQTAGAFDVTIGSVVNLWGFGPDAGDMTVPDEGSIMTALQRTGYDHISLRETPRGVKKDIAEIYLDLSGIAKGFAVDRLAELLNEKGINNYLVEIGGEVRARGHKLQGETWRIGIEKPMVEGREIQRIIELQNLSMATSGDYRNFFTYDGERFSHTIDPETGWPVKHSDHSVTVLHDSAMYADALATALSVMDVERGLRYANESNLAVLFILRRDGSFSETYSPAFSQLLDQ